MIAYLKSCLLALALIAVPVSAESAPAFTLADALGQQVSLADYAGQPVILHFWASWCPACKKVQPTLQALADEYRHQGLVLLGVNFAEDDDVDPQQVLGARGHRFKTLVEGEAVVKLYGVKGTPTTFFITREGEIVGVSNAYRPNDPELRQMLALIL